MTREEIKTFSELNEKFMADCKRVRRAMISTNCDGRMIYCAYTYRCMGNEVIWYGEGESDYPNSHGDYFTENYVGSFPIEYLSMSDEELYEELKRKV